MSSTNMMERTDEPTFGIMAKRQSVMYRRGSYVNLTSDMTVGQAFRFNRRNSVEESDLVVNGYRGFHYTVDVRFYNQQNAKDLGETVVAEMLKATKRHGIRSVGDMLQVFDGSQSPPGFASVILLDESHMTAHCYSDEGMLAFDCFTCGSNPEGTRRMTVDMVAFFEARFGSTAKIEVGHMPRFPVNSMDVKALESKEGMLAMEEQEVDTNTTTAITELERGRRAAKGRPMKSQSTMYRRGSYVNLTSDMTIGQAFRFNRRQSVAQSDLVVNGYRGFHYTVDVRFYNQQDAKDLGETVVAEMLQATKRHGIRSVGEMLQVFDGSLSPPGFASAILLDESHMTAHCYSDEGMLAFDCFTCGSNPEGTRRMTVDMVAFFEARFGSTAKIEVGHMPRFPVNSMDVPALDAERFSMSVVEEQA